MIKVKEKPILFSTEMVKAILAGKKAQTRRVIRPQPVYFPAKSYLEWTDKRGLKSGCPLKDAHWWLTCPYGQPGNDLWVRETWTVGGRAAKLKISEMSKAYQENVIYRADVDKPIFYDWKPSIFMPRWASRIDLKITGIRVQRVQEISLGDIRAEGLDPLPVINPRGDFAQLWDRINAPRGYGWKANPWVWVIEFRRAGASPSV